MRVCSHVISLLLLCALASACGDSNLAAASGAVPGTHGPPGIVVRNDGSTAAAVQQGAFQRTTIIDPSGFGQPMPAFSLQMPRGWLDQGTTQWSIGGCTAGSPSLAWRARSPDGRQAMEFIPSWASQQATAYAGQIYPNCPMAPFNTIRDYLQHLASQRRPNGRVLDYRERPDLTASVQVPSLPDQTGAPVRMRFQVQAGEILVAYEENGQAMRESIVTRGTFTEIVSDFPMLGTQRTLGLLTDGAMSLSAPDGELDFALLEQVRASIAAEPEWRARVQQMMRGIAADNQRTQTEIARINARGSQVAMQEIAKRGQIMAGTRAEIAAINTNTWNNTQATNERIQARGIDAMREVQPYYDPIRGTPVEVDNRYQYLWRLTDGSYYQTNDPAFNPALALGMDGQQLQMIQR